MKPHITKRIFLLRLERGQVYSRSRLSVASSVSVSDDEIRCLSPAGLRWVDGTIPDSKCTIASW